MYQILFFCYLSSDIENFRISLRFVFLYLIKEKLKNADEATLLGMAFDCGFNSKATFNRAFKKFTGVSPKEFQEKSAQ